jgi:hypothetical protein
MSEQPDPPASIESDQPQKRRAPRIWFADQSEPTELPIYVTVRAPALLEDDATGESGPSSNLEGGRQR